MTRIHHILLSCLVLACSNRAAGSGEAETSEGSGSSSGQNESTSAGVTSATTDDPSDTGVTTEYEASSEATTSTTPDYPSWYCGEPCDIWTPGDCGPDRKCTVVSCEGVWDSHICVDIQGTGQLGDECEYTEGSSVSGNDTCDEGYLCWDVDPDTGLGNCLAFCTNSVDDPQCPDQHACVVTYNGYLPFCLPYCDPLGADCDDNELCVASEGAFFCVLDASGDMAPYGTACNYANSCNYGLACIEGASVPEPDCENAQGCCSPYCDVNLPNDCPGVGQECFPIYDPPLEGYEHVGVCSLVQP